MLHHFKIFFTIFFLFSTTYSAEIEIVTYNTGLARAMGKDFVPCVKPRLNAFLNHVLKKTNVPSVYLFQEVFYQDAYRNIQRWALENGFHVTESNSQRNGLMIVSELPIQTEFLQRFSCGKFMQNPGILTARIGSEKQHVIDILTAHTNDSDGNKPNECQVTQLNELSGHFNSRTGTVFMGGDFNVGPDLKILNQKYDPIKRLWEPFKRLVLNAFRAPTEKQGVTWDIENNILARGGHIPKEKVQGPQDNSTLDHIYFKGDVELVDSSIVFNQPVEVRDCHEYESEPGKTHMSDHYGIRARINLKSISSFADL